MDMDMVDQNHPPLIDTPCGTGMREHCIMQLQNTSDRRCICVQITSLAYKLKRL